MTESRSGISELKENSGTKIPPFYIPGIPLNLELKEKQDEIINRVFTKEEIKDDEFNEITINIMGLPKMFNKVFFNKIDIEKKGRISKKAFLKYYKEFILMKDTYRIFFNIIKYPSKEEYISRQDFMPFLLHLLDVHLGLEFLKTHPDFQNKYCK